MPDNNTFYPKETSINFTVKNLSPNRKIRIFNYPLLPGQTRDLLAIPEISEADIRHSLIKGDLANLIRNKTITIVSSSIDLSQFDIQQAEFLAGAGIIIPQEQLITAMPPQTQPFWYIDGVNGSDSNDGFTSSTALKTNAELIRRVGVPWTVSESVLVTYLNYPSDPLRLDVDLEQPTALNSAPFLVFDGMPFQQFSTGILSAVTNRNRATNTPNQVQDGTVVTTSDVGRRIRITSGIRAGLTSWVAKSTGAGLRRTSEWCTVETFGVNLGVPTITQPQVGDHYVIESNENRQLILGHIRIRQSAAAPFEAGGLGTNQATVIFSNVDFAPIQNGAEPHIVNGCGGMNFISCGFWGGAWALWTNTQESDNVQSYTSFANCCFEGTPAPAPIEGIGNLDVMAGSFVDNFILAGLIFGNVTPQQGAGMQFDFDPLCQGSFAQPATASAGQLAIVTLGVMDFTAGGILCQDGVVGMTAGSGFSGYTPSLWGVSAGSGWGVDVRSSSTFRYAAGSLITITAAGGDFRLGGMTTGRSWNETGGAYSSAITCSWANLFNAASLNNNAHNVAQNAHIFENTSDSEP